MLAIYEARATHCHIAVGLGPPPVWMIATAVLDVDRGVPRRSEGRGKRVRCAVLDIVPRVTAREARVGVNRTTVERREGREREKRHTHTHNTQHHTHTKPKVACQGASQAVRPPDLHVLPVATVDHHRQR